MGNYFPQFYNPQYPQQFPQFQQPQQTFPQGQSGGMIWVGSSMEAEQYLMAPNSAVTLWDKNAPAVYIKQTDASGRPTMKTYDLVERKPAPPPIENQKVEYATKAELDALVARVEALATPARKTKKEADE